jgi:hypothetical protein
MTRPRIIAFALTVIGVAVGAGVAVAALSATVLADTNTVREKIVRNEFTPDTTTPTFASGWHEHPGIVVVQVQSGKLTIQQNCRNFKLGPGDVYIEVPYLPVNATTNVAVQWTSTLILANSAPGTPDRTAVPQPSCSDDDDD